MTTKIEYLYASGDLLAQPNTYFYTAFQGVEFISAWESSRAECSAECFSVEVVDGKSDNQDVSGDGSSTGQFLNRLIALFDMADLPPEEWRNIDALLRNFEAKKRIYEDYYPGFTSKDRTDYLQLGLYVRFAEVMVLSYRSSQKLPYLNALIKCLDVLCALRTSLSNAEKTRLRGLIAAEGDFVNQLSRQLGVSKS